MKKVVIVLAMLVAATTTQAAAIKWQATNIKQPADSSVAATDGWAAFWFDATVVNSQDLAAALAGGDFSGVAGASYTASVTSGRINTSVGNYSAGDRVMGFTVIFDNADYNSAENFLVTSTLDKSINALGSDLTYSFGSQATASWTAITGGGGGDVPEPTSGLLLLVGGAMLALRRKQK